MPAVVRVRPPYNAGVTQSSDGPAAMTQKQKLMMGRALALSGLAAVLAFAYSAYLSPAMVLGLADLNLCF